MNYELKNEPKQTQIKPNLKSGLAKMGHHELLNIVIKYDIISLADIQVFL